MLSPWPKNPWARNQDRGAAFGCCSANQACCVWNTRREGWLYGTVIFAYPLIYLTLAQRRFTQRSYWRCTFNTLVLGPVLTLTSVGIVVGLAAFSFLTF
jgi:hypothetical protein